MPSRSTAIALLAVFLAAAGGTATAAKLIDGDDIRDRSLATKELKKSAVRSLRRGAAAPVTGARITDATVTGADLADRTLTAGKLMADTITSTEIGTGAAGEDEVAADSVGNSEIKGNSISRNQLRPAVLRAGAVSATLGSIPSGRCVAQTITPAATYQIPTGAFVGNAILIGAPAALPDGLLVSGRSPDGSNLRVQVCNLTADAVTLGELSFPFTTFGT